MKTQNVLLINPWIYDFTAYDFWNKPIGLLYLAAMLRQNGVNLSFLDCLNPYHPDMRLERQIVRPKRRPSGEGTYARACIVKPDPLKNIPRRYHRYGITPEVFLKSLQQLPRPDVVMMTSMMTYWYPAVYDAIGLVHRTFPGTPIVLGGNYVTLCPEHAARSGADFCVAGSAEKSLPFLFDFFPHQETRFLPDHNLDSLPYPAFDLVHRADQVPIMTSRGCPYRCSYCASHLLNGSFRRRDPVLVADEIEYWHIHLGIRHFSFYDDALLLDPEEMAIPLFSELIRRQLPLQLHCPNGLHLREIDARMSNLMLRAGFKTIRLGFETADILRQTSTGGKVSNAEFIEAVSLLKKIGYSSNDIRVYLLLGLPEQSAEEVRESIRFVQSYGARPVIAEYSPIPGTRLWEEAVASSSYPIDEEPLFQNNTILPCRSASLTDEIVQSLKLMTRARDPS